MYAIYREVIGSAGTTIISALILLFTGLVVTHILARIFQSVLSGLELNTTLKNLLHTSVPAEEVLRLATVYLGTFLTIILVLIQLGIASTILIILASAVILIVFISLLLSMKDLIPNAIAGALVRQRHLVAIGDMIEVKGMTGTVVDCSLLETTIQTKKKELLRIPNSVLVKSEIKILKSKKKK